MDDSDQYDNENRGRQQYSPVNRMRNDPSMILVLPQDQDLWEDALNLLNLPSIQVLPEEHQQRLVDILRNETDSSQALNFINQLACVQLLGDTFAQQIISLTISGKNYQQPQDALDAIFSSKPKSSRPNPIPYQPSIIPPEGIFDRYKTNAHSLEGQMISLRNQQEGLNMKGVIVSAKYEDEQFTLVVEQREEESIMTFSGREPLVRQIQVTYKRDQNQHLGSSMQLLTNFIVYQFEENQRSISLASVDLQRREDRREIDSIIQSRKQILVKKIQQTQVYKAEFQILILKLIEGQIEKQNPSEWKILSQIQKIAKITQKITHQSIFYQITREILTDANFATLTEGESSNVVSSRVVDLLKTAEEKAKTLLEKDMVVFYGLTGEGKSTIIDYLMGYTLEKIENGPNIGKYEIKAGQITQEQSCSPTGPSKIGHGFISQTLFSKGCEIIKNRFPFLKIGNAILGESSGFNQNRGQQQKICTLFSQDQAIQNCKSIKAIVLVVDENKLTKSSSRGSLFFDSIRNLQKLYPNLLDPEGKVFSNFYIMVNKCSFDNQSVTLQENLEAWRREFQDYLYKNNGRSQGIEIQDSEHITTLSCLFQMCKQQRMIRINPGKQDDALKILKRLLSHSTPVPKTQYTNQLQTSDTWDKLQSKYEEQYSLWANKILPLYFSYTVHLAGIDQQQSRIKNKIGQTIKKIERLKETITDNEKTLTDLKEYQLPKAKLTLKELQIFQNEINPTASVILSDWNDGVLKQFVKSHRQTLKRRDVYQRNLQAIKKGKDEKTKAAQKNKVEQLIIKQEIKKLENGFETKQKQIRKFKIGAQEVAKKGERFQKTNPIKQDKLLSLDQRFLKRKTVFVNGSKEVKMYGIFNLPKDKYKFEVEGGDFDRKGLIKSKCLDKQTQGGHIYKIRSKNTTLQDVQFLTEKKQILFCFQYLIPKSRDQLDMPYLIFEQKTPKKLLNKTLIAAKRQSLKDKQQESKKLSADLTLLNGKISQISKDIDQENKQIADLNQKIRVENDNKKLYLQQCKKIQKEQNIKKMLSERRLLRQGQIKNIIENISKMERLILNNKDNLKKPLVELEILEANLKDLEKIREKTKRYQKRFVFLIQEQLHKQIPQTLKQMIVFSKQMEKRVKEQMSDEEQKRRNDRHQLFNLFLEKLKEVVQQIKVQ